MHKAKLIISGNCGRFELLRRRCCLLIGFSCNKQIANRASGKMAADSNVRLSGKKTVVNFGPIRKFWVFLRARSFRWFNHRSRYFLPLLLMTDSLHQDRRLPLTTLNLCLCAGTAFIFESRKNLASTGPFAVMKFKNGSSRFCRGTAGNYFHSDLFSVPDSSVSC